MDSDKNFDHLKVGDDVVMTNFGQNYRIAKIERITTTQIVVEGLKFRRDTGYIIGKGSYSRTYLQCSNSAFLKARRYGAENALKHGFPFSQAGVLKALTAANEAEKVLRESGEWKDAP